MAFFIFYGRSAENQLISTVEHDNIVLATAMANEIISAFPEHFQVPHTPDTLKQNHHRRHIVDIDRGMRRLVEASPVLALNVFWNDLTIYSSQQELIGTIKKSPGFLIARRGGKAVSNLVFKETFNVFEGEVMDRDIVETYVPVRLPDHLAHIGATLILEIYTDVSTVIAKIARTKRQLLAGLVLGFGALYVMLFLIVRHADTIISRHDKRFRDFAESSSDWLWEMDENLRFTFHSDRYFEITGFRPEDKIGTTRTRYVDPSNLSVDVEKWDAHKADLEALRPFKNFEFAFKAKDGATINARISGTPVFNAEGKFLGYRGTGTDITERVKAEEATGRLVAAIEGLSENFALYGPDEKLVICNQGYRRLNEAISEATRPGVSYEDHIRAVVEKGLAPQSLGREEEWVQQRLARFRNPGKPFEVARQDGRWLLVHEQRMLDGSTATIATDITERKRIEEALKESEERFRSVIDNSPSFINLKDADGRFQLVNRKNVEMLGLEPPDIVGKSVFDLFPKKGAEEAIAHHRKVLETKSVITEERQAFIKQGTRDFLITKFPILDGSGDVVRIGTIGTDITERKQSEKTRERLSQAIENVPVGIVLFDSDDRLVFFNNRYGEMMESMADILKSGVTFEEMIRTIVDRQPVKDAQGREEEYIQERIKQHRNPTGPIEICREDKWLMANETRLPDGSTFTIITDITEHKKAEIAKQEMENRFQAVVDSSPAAITLKDSDGVFLLVNRTYGKWMSANPSDLLGKTSHDVFPQKQADEIVSHDQKVMETGEEIIKEAIRSYKDGQTRTVLIQKCPIFSFEGEATAISTFILDISERKQTEKALEESQARLMNIMDNSPAPIYFKDTEGRFLVANRRYQEMYGIKFEDIKGKTSKEIFGDELGEVFFDHDQEVLNSGKAIEREENFLGRHYLTLKFPIVDPNGMLLGLGGVETDVTEIKAAEEGHRQALFKAEEANQAKSEFLAAMSHDLRTPLNAIIGFADILSHQYFGPIGDKNREYAGDIKASGEHLLELVNEILDLSTIEAGKQSLVKEKLSTEEVVRECEKIMEDKARSNGINLVTKVPKDLPPLYADKRAFKQILLNLLSNAVKFTPEGGRITVSAKASKRNITLKIIDTGKGIPAEKLSKLTDPFTRTDADPYVAEQGWGLGLAITNSLVDLHDGKLDIKSTLGKGTTVTVTLPNSAL